MKLNIKKLLLSVLSCVLCIGLVSCTVNQEKIENSGEKEMNSEPLTNKEGQMPLEPSILFIGNSATYYNDMPTILFYNIINDAGYDAAVFLLAKGGQYLIDSANPENELGADVEKTLGEQKFDYVVLQDQTLCPINEPEKFDSGIRTMVEKVRKNGATPILYSTVARAVGNPELAERGLTNESMTFGVAKGYKAIGEELGVDVAHVGLAFYDVHNNQDIELYDTDKAHPGKAGSYLAALTIYARMTGNDPTEITYNAEFDEDVAAALKTAAKNAVFNTPEIPE